ncbi:response regulator transcription factor [Clostridium beijerinckii]|uniref:Stage 0 sporulation protein A homolog n=1 Tax=Clostridium beijerinckii TaxID=1520 RepID=A0A9Q5GF87_CLOBE|nr:response regulator transcription factor [Clostridium beijerinckii]AQS04148.1 transcriptional regulatory protein WalR [Clostridium beijerinckii]MBA2883965.1 DNA-binding response OmpR family regulator [Clostridium beijerinckii]MBA2899149.1 DNA-binding response OmpR family regulator [Clostridium beijerinckii]MBA2908551.1 DNA-binding response OmpR family regulator [Clostridium beijerinckii]MBA9016303.1 DNA-binding response OmpR family regulator [Clostridium beijerinckii]
MHSEKILVVDDDKDIRRILKIYLINAGYEVILASNGKEALELIEDNIKLILLDVMMSEMDGLEVCVKIREKYNMPIIFLTAKSEVIDKVAGLTAGGDDYITKPFQSIELIARVQANLRRYTYIENNTAIKEDKNDILIDDLNINLTSYTVKKNGSEVSLTKTEFSILKLLVKNRGRVFNIEQIYENVWQKESILNAENTVSVHIKKLREKIEDDVKKPKYIKTVWGIGYRID